MGSFMGVACEILFRVYNVNIWRLIYNIYIVKRSHIICMLDEGKKF